MEVVPLSQTCFPTSRPSVSCCQSLITRHLDVRCSRVWWSNNNLLLKNTRVKMAAECATNLGPVEVTRSSDHFDDEMGDDAEEVAEWMKSGRLKEKCGGAERGVVELLECLEREAIMGDDHGREPNDYNRRAQIFDRSSRVFQALRERDTNTTTPATVDGV
ncbi:uncharacterized protein LOC115705132 [Cannabis sativa]|jgi:hypothetical protein|nr:uncharacterized protein LOC115705132 [Cannabis sativa]